MRSEPIASGTAPGTRGPPAGPRARISWLIPVRDAQATIGAAVASALTECREGDEVLVVDDGSRDGTREAIPGDGRVRVLCTGRQGLVAALEAGREACRGTLIARLDADDLALPGRAAAQAALLAARPEVAAVGGRARIHRAGGPAPEGMRRYVTWVNGLEDPSAELLVESPLFHPAVTFRAAAVHAVGGYRLGTFPEDYDLWLRLVAAGYRLANLPRDVVLLHDRPERLTRTDPRYTLAAFRRCRGWFLEQVVIPRPARVVLWAGRKGGGPWLRWLRERRHEIVAVVDIDPRARHRGGTPVVPPEALPRLCFDQLLVAVGARGGREQVRARLAQVRPDLVEGRDWRALA